MSDAGDRLGTAIKTAVEALTPAEKTDLELAWQTIANPIVAFIDVPVGVILPWHKDLSGTPTLSDSWAELNGQTISDSESPYDGVTLPDLNNQARFIRGNNISGVEQGDTVKEHTHDTYDPGLDVTKVSGSDGSVTLSGLKTAPFGDTETRPINISMIFIIKIK